MLKYFVDERMKLILRGHTLIQPVACSVDINLCCMGSYHGIVVQDTYRVYIMCQRIICFVCADQYSVALDLLFQKGSSFFVLFFVF